MRLVDIQNISRTERENWENRLQNNQQVRLQDIYKFIKDNNISLTDIEKQMIIDANEMSKDEIKKKLKIKLKTLFSGYGKNYELELNTKIKQQLLIKKPKHNPFKLVSCYQSRINLINQKKIRIIYNEVIKIKCKLCTRDMNKHKKL